MTSLIKYKFSFALACLFLAGIACTKTNSDYSHSALPNSNITSLINKAWKLSQYIIITDKQDYVFTNSDIAGHALNTLLFSYPTNYAASDTFWSGFYSFSSDSTIINLNPVNPSLVELILSIDHLSPQVMVISTAVVNCDQQIPEPSDFEKFVAVHSKMWLYNRGIDVSEIKSVKIKFIYSSR